VVAGALKAAGNPLTQDIVLKGSTRKQEVVEPVVPTQVPDRAYDGVHNRVVEPGRHDARVGSFERVLHDGRKQRFRVDLQAAPSFF
jgi:hypothetical protein